MDEEGKLYVKNFIICEINMDKIMSFWYDKEKEEIDKFKHLIMLNLNLEELNILSKNDKVVKRYMQRLERVNNDPKFQSYMSYEEDQRKIRNTELLEAREEGLKEGLKEQAIAIAKNLINIGMPLLDISKATGLSIEKIEKLKE